MKRKMVIILLTILVVFILVLFGTEKLLSKRGNSYMIKVPRDSYCKEKQNSNSIVQTCTYIGGHLIFEESPNENKISFKRKLTNNNCYEIDLINKKIQSQDICIINESKLYASSLEKIDAGLDKSILKDIPNGLYLGSPSGRYNIEHYVKGKIIMGRGIGWIGTSDRLFGLEIFEVGDQIDNKILYRKVKVKFGGSWDLESNIYWGDNDNFLIFDRGDRFYYLPFD